MSTALQVPLFVASVAVIVLAACIVPLAFQARRRLGRLALTAEEFKADVKVLVQDSREMVRNMNELATRANRQLGDTAKVVNTVQRWTERADRLVDEVGSAIEPPVFSLVRNMNLFRTGATTFLQTIFRTKQNNHQTKQEKDHV